MPIHLKIYCLYCLIVVLDYLYLKWIYIPMNRTKLLSSHIKGTIEPPIYVFSFLIIVLVLWGLGLIVYEIVIS